MEKLFVTFKNCLIGELQHEAERGYSFIYDEQWIRSPHGFSLSPVLDKNIKKHTSFVGNFFQNLLPEGKALDDLSSYTRISKSNIMALLGRSGKEIAGAVEINRHEKNSATLDAPWREVTQKELNERILIRDTIPFTVWDKKVRFSVAGYQDKLCVFKNKNGKMYLADGEITSNIIIKPNSVNPNIPGIVANEYFCMQVAKKTGLNIPDFTYKKIPEPIFEIERFDRIQQAEFSVDRIHVIDGCQALGLPVSHKIERNFGNDRDVQDIREGVSFALLFDLAEKTNIPIKTKQDILDWAVFNYTIGNSDAHGKNISFFMNPEGAELAPYYDLVSTELYDDVVDEMAMAIGDEFMSANVEAYDWITLADENKIPLSILKGTLNKYSYAIESAAAEELKNEIYSPEDKEVLNKVFGIIQNRSQRLKSFAYSVKDEIKVKQDLRIK